MTVTGGYGQIAHGRHKYGARDSEDFAIPPAPLGPRFNYSSPLDGAHNVNRSQWIVFELYYYSSAYASDTSIPPPGALFEISEDGGTTWADASIAPYTLTTAFKDGQILWVKIIKAGLWTDNEEVVIRTNLSDEFGQPSTDEFPVRWE